jgi:hypothetical protein
MIPERPWLLALRSWDISVLWPILGEIESIKAITRCNIDGQQCKDPTDSEELARAIMRRYFVL